MHSLNLMLPKEDRRAMLLRLYNDHTTEISNTMLKRSDPAQESTPDTPAMASGSETVDSGAGAALDEAEEKALKKENEAMRQDQQDQTETRETWTKAGDEEDRFNTTV